MTKHWLIDLWGGVGGATTTRLFGQRPLGGCVCGLSTGPVEPDCWDGHQSCQISFGPQTQFNVWFIIGKILSDFYWITLKYNAIGAFSFCRRNAPIKQFAFFKENKNKKRTHEYFSRQSHEGSLKLTVFFFKVWLLVVLSFSSSIQLIYAAPSSVSLFVKQSIFPTGRAYVVLYFPLFHLQHWGFSKFDFQPAGSYWQSTAKEEW